MVTWDEVRELALSLPEVTERSYYRNEAFAVRGKAFAGMSRHEGAIWTRCDPDERPLLIASNPTAYRLTPHFETALGYLLIWLDDAERDDVRDRLVDAWLLKAPRDVAAAFARS